MGGRKEGEALPLSCPPFVRLRRSIYDTHDNTRRVMSVVRIGTREPSKPPSYVKITTFNNDKERLVYRNEWEITETMNEGGNMYLSLRNAHDDTNVTKILATQTESIPLDEMFQNDVRYPRLDHPMIVWA